MKNILTSFLLVFSFISLCFAGGSHKGGQNFRKAAKKYSEKAEYWASKGKYQKANLYRKLASIKEEAAVKADQGE